MPAPVFVVTTSAEAASSQPLEVVVSPSSQDGGVSSSGSFSSGNFVAVVTGGQAPYQHSWTVQPNEPGDSGSLTTDGANTNTFSFSVTGASGGFKSYTLFVSVTDFKGETDVAGSTYTIFVETQGGGVQP